MVNIAKLTKKRLGELLTDEGLINDIQVEDALSRQKEMGELLGEALVNLGYVSEYDIARAITQQFGLPFINAKLYSVDPDVLHLVPAQMMFKNQFVILDKINNTILIAVSGLLNIETFEEIEMLTKAKLFIYVSTTSMVMDVLNDNLSDEISVGGGS